MTNTEKYRHEIGYSVRKLASESGVDRHPIFRIEEGKGQKTYTDTYYKLAKFFATKLGKDIEEVYKELLQDKKGEI